ncbi:MAG: hypothetical protein GXO79_02190 [Chlorobi bacterium]|nr:hypothetical protein [Chlorobiota bacterium]
MKRSFICILLFLFSQSVFAQKNWDFEICSGFIYNFPSPLIITQNNYPTIKLWAKYETEPFRLPPYYDLRITRLNEGKGWDFEFFHHKIYLANKPPEIQRFSVSHGYNVFTVKRVNKLNSFIIHYGGGFVLAHPENTIRNYPFDEKLGIGGKGYYFSGIVSEFAIDKRIYFTKYLYATAESKITASYSIVPVYSGNANIALLTLHLIFGIGVEL